MQFSSSSRILAAVLAITSATVLTDAGRAQCVPQWGPGFSGINGGVTSCATAPNGDIVVAGLFTTIGGIAANHIAVRSAATGNWSALGTGVGNFVEVVTVRSNGNIVAGGNFVSAGGTAVTSIAEWNGTTWSALGAPMNPGATVNAILELPNQDLIVGGQISTIGGVAVGNVARWNGTTWSPLATGIPVTGVNSDVYALALMANGRVAIGGRFGTVSPNIAALGIVEWNPATGLFSQVGPASTTSAIGVGGEVRALALDATGGLVVGGSFGNVSGTVPGTAIPARNVARWNGAFWSAMGGGLGLNGNELVRALALHPSGRMIAGGEFPTDGFGGTLNFIAQWNGAAWSPLGSGVGGFSPRVFSLTIAADSDIFTGGTFDTAGGIASFGLASYDVCDAGARPYGNGCTGSAGPVALTAVTMPWVGTTFTARGTGMPAVSLALGVWGNAQASVPLNTLLPQALAGCDLLATPDLLLTLTPAGGTVTSQWAIPLSASILGGMVWHQLAVLEFGAGGAITAVTSSNGLELTIGGI
ncbi:MAG: hypothetical protein KDC98_10060 [Planctomycetes bacterium]|nr:hypothetical protein [Planctomycetota bacterium]